MISMFAHNINEVVSTLPVHLHNLVATELNRLLIMPVCSSSSYDDSNEAEITFVLEQVPYGWLSWGVLVSGDFLHYRQIGIMGWL